MIPIKIPKIIPIPPVNGVGLEWNFLLLLGTSISKFMLTAILLKTPTIITVDIKDIKINTIARFSDMN